MAMSFMALEVIPSLKLTDQGLVDVDALPESRPVRRMSDLSQTILGPILIPRADGKVDFLPDGAMSCDASERSTTSVPLIRSAVACLFAKSRRSRGLILPPSSTRTSTSRSTRSAGISWTGSMPPPEGRLLAGLNRNVFPAEARCASDAIARQVVREFAATLSRKASSAGRLHDGPPATPRHRASSPARLLAGRPGADGDELPQYSPRRSRHVIDTNARSRRNVRHGGHRYRPLRRRGRIALRQGAARSRRI
jgi:hypothetical protein